jgi:hypothetical protein
MLSIGALVDSTVKTVVAPNVDTTYTGGAAQPRRGAARDRRARHARGVTTCSSCSTPTRIPPATSGGARPAPTPLVWLLSRTLVKGAADVPSVTELMRGYRVTPLAGWTAGAREPPVVLPAFPPNQTRLVLPEGVAIFDALGAYLAANPPPAGDACAPARLRHGWNRRGAHAFERFARGGSKDPGGGAAVDERLVSRAVARANAYTRRRNNGWLVPLGCVGDYGRNYLGRAVIAKFGANTPDETIYPSALTDSRGRPLSGDRSYTRPFPAWSCRPSALSGR